jgi:PEP-CTERM motif
MGLTARLLRTAGFVTLLVSGLTFAAEASVVYPISAIGSSSYPGYDASFAIDSGPGGNVTDWASFQQGVGSTLKLDLGAVYTLLSANVTDRVTSGSGNGAFFGGTFDFTTQFSIQAFSDSTFAVALGGPLVFLATTPSTPTSLGSFFTLADLTGLPAAEFLQYTVLATNGVNPGLSDISFTAAVPEPSTWALILLGFAGLGAMSQRRKRQQLKIV